MHKINEYTSVLFIIYHYLEGVYNTICTPLKTILFTKAVIGLFFIRKKVE